MVAQDVSKLVVLLLSHLQVRNIIKQQVLEIIRSKILELLTRPMQQYGLEYADFRIDLQWFLIHAHLRYDLNDSLFIYLYSFHYIDLCRLCKPFLG